MLYSEPELNFARKVSDPSTYDSITFITKKPETVPSCSQLDAIAECPVPIFVNPDTFDEKTIIVSDDWIDIQEPHYILPFSHIDDLCSRAKHKYAAELHEEFLKKLVVELQQGTFQAKYKKWLYISGRNKEVEIRNAGIDSIGVSHVFDTFLDTVDFGTYAGIMLDNGRVMTVESNKYKYLGEGLEALEAIRHIDSTIPVFYQTGTPLTEFPLDEYAAVRGFPNTWIVPKNIFLKQHPSRQAAEKELFLLKYLKQCELIADYVVDPYHLDLDGYVEAPDICFTATHVPTTPKRSRIRGELRRRYEAGLNDEYRFIERDQAAHRLAVISTMHSYLSQAELPVQLPQQNFLPFDEVLEILAGREEISEVEELREIYESLLEQEVDKLYSTPIHGDTQGSNWMRGQFLGDLGSSCYGSYLKDIARLLLYGNYGHKAGKWTYKEHVRRDHILGLTNKALLIYEHSGLDFSFTKEDLWKWVVVEATRVAARKKQTYAEHLVPSMLSAAFSAASLLKNSQRRVYMTDN